MPKPVKESASFRIVNGENAVSFKVDGSVVLAIVEAFTWLSPDRRLILLKRLEAKQAQLLEKEASRAATKEET